MDGSAGNKRILVTGASGFIGKATLEALTHGVPSNHIYCLSRLSHKNTPQINWLQCDLFNKTQIENCLKELQPDVLIHLAWGVTPRKFWDAEENIDWLYYSANLFRTFLKYGGMVFIGAGSIAEYDLSKSVLQGTLPNTLYGNCKLSLRQLIFQLKNIYQSQVKIIWPQIGWPFGEQEPEEKFFSQIYYKLVKNQRITLSAKDCELPYIYVKHLGLAIAECMKCPTDGIFPLCSFSSIRLEEIIEQIAHYLNKSYQINYAVKSSVKTYKLNLDAIPPNIRRFLEVDTHLDIKDFLKKMGSLEGVRGK